MLDIKTKTIVKNDISEKIKKNLRDLSKKKVVCGFPKGKLNQPHYDNGESIIDVAIMNNYGMGVPRRDFMTPSSEKWSESCNKKVKEMGDDLVLGKINAEAFLSMLGEDGAEIIKEEIINLDSPPNSPITIALKGSSNPLVDTGDLSKAPIYELREKNE